MNYTGRVLYEITKELSISSTMNIMPGTEVPEMIQNYPEFFIHPREAVYIGNKYIGELDDDYTVMGGTSNQIATMSGADLVEGSETIGPGMARVTLKTGDLRTHIADNIDLSSLRSLPNPKREVTMAVLDYFIERIEDYHNIRIAINAAGEQYATVIPEHLEEFKNVMHEICRVCPSIERGIAELENKVLEVTKLDNYLLVNVFEDYRILAYNGEPTVWDR